MNISVDERAQAASAGRADRARALAVRLLTTTRPQSPRTIARARWIGRTCSVVLLALGLWFAATGTWQGDLIALYSITTGVWCWRHQRHMRPTR